MRTMKHLSISDANHIEPYSELKKSEHALDEQKKTERSEMCVESGGKIHTFNFLISGERRVGDL